MSRLNFLLLIGYLLGGITVFIAALAVPAFRAIAYAPLREWILPPPEPVIISVLYSTEKEAWLKESIAHFEQTQPTVNGRPIQLALKQMGSREMYLNVLDGTEKPDVLSPAGFLQISMLQDLSTRKFGAPLVKLNDRTNCRSVVSTPLVLVAWKHRADVLWGANPGAKVWPQLHDALINPKGWETLKHPEWGYVKFGHTDPLKSNSGFMTILLMTYDYFDRTTGLTSADILSNAEYQKWFVEFEKTISTFGDSTGTYMKDMVAYGPSRYDIIAVYEATAIEQAENAVGRYGELRVYYPPATVLSDHPFCILEATWGTPDKKQAAQLFLDYLSSRPAQELALLKYGFRPTDQTIPLDQTGSPFTRYAANGFTRELPLEVQVPPGDVLNTLLDFWQRTAKR